MSKQHHSASYYIALQKEHVPLLMCSLFDPFTPSIHTGHCIIFHARSILRFGGLFCPCMNQRKLHALPPPLFYHALLTCTLYI